jgi:hypothetical protein
MQHLWFTERVIDVANGSASTRSGAQAKYIRADDALHDAEQLRLTQRLRGMLDLALKLVSG